MPELIEQMYCSQQIVIPPKFPYILKKFCKAAIKTQPYDLLRWSYEYFSALAQNRPPPVKLRLEYPIYSTEGGLTRGCLKVLVNQLGCSKIVLVNDVEAAWRGFCLDPEELKRILCLCEVHLRENEVPFLHFIAVAGGLLTKTLTHTMILLCESLTKEPDGGSAAIPVQDFLTMYTFLAPMDASKDVKYIDGYREGAHRSSSEVTVGDEEKSIENEESVIERSDDDFCQDRDEYPVQTLLITNDHVSRSTRLSLKLKAPILEIVEMSPSMERRVQQLEQENDIVEKEGQEHRTSITSGDADDQILEQPVADTDKVNPEDNAMILDTEEYPGENITKDTTKEAEEEIPVPEVIPEDTATILENEEYPDENITQDTTKEAEEEIPVPEVNPEDNAMILDTEEYPDENTTQDTTKEAEEEIPVSEVTMVYCVPGIGASVDADIMREFEEFALEVSEAQANLFMPRNVRHFMCPPLERYIEPDDEAKKWKATPEGASAD